MEVINIFLAGSTRLAKERNLIRSCANKLQADNCAKGRQIAINITTFENFNSAITDKSAQKQYDDYINTVADYAMFIFDNQVGDISRHEFNVAYEAFSRSNRPALYIYFKKTDSYCPQYEEIRKFLEHTDNYFQEYDDFHNLSQMIDSHLREIIEPSVEKIIIDSYKGKGRLTFISNRDCRVTENHSNVAELSANVPLSVQMTEGAHTFLFNAFDSSDSLEKEVNVIRETGRKVEVFFPVQTVPAPKPKPRSMYYIFGAVIVAFLVSIWLVPAPMNRYDDNYSPDEISSLGGYKYQLALEAIEHGDYTKAVELLKTVINAEPTFPDPYIHLAAIYINQDEVEKARELLVTALELNPESSWATDLYDSIN